MPNFKYLAFRCTGCGNCCREPLLPLTHTDVARVARHTGLPPTKFVRWVAKAEIDMDDEPESFVNLQEGRRVMVMKQTRTGCRFLGKDDRCTIYRQRPLGCRVYPFDPTVSRSGKLRRLELIGAANCEYALDGENDPDAILSRQERYDRDKDRYHERVAAWNERQVQRKRQGLKAQSARSYFQYLGIPTAQAQASGTKAANTATAAG